MWTVSYISMTSNASQKKHAIYTFFCIHDTFYSGVRNFNGKMVWYAIYQLIVMPFKNMSKTSRIADTIKWLSIFSFRKCTLYSFIWSIKRKEQKKKLDQHFVILIGSHETSALLFVNIRCGRRKREKENEGKKV